MELESKILSTVQNFDQEIIPDTCPTELPLLIEYKKEFRTKDYFRDTDVLFIQHHLGPFIPKIREMCSDGLEKERSWFVDIPYSTNIDTKNQLSDEGFSSDRMTNLYNMPLDDYDKNQSDRIKFLLFRLAGKTDLKKLLVIDDGAYFLRYLISLNIHDPKLCELFRGTKIVEQTTRGHRFIQNFATEIIKKYELSIVSIARCCTKLHFEARFIGAAVSRALTNKLGDDSLNRMRNLAVIGFGAVGRAVVDRLLTKSPFATIDVIDIEPAKREEAAKTNKMINAIKALDQKKQYELVIGCTGYTSFELSDRKLLADEAYLASGSSAAIEFNRQGFIELADKYPDDEIEVLDRDETIKSGIHANIKFKHEGGKKFTFLNAGFAVNFDGKMEHIPIRIIQSTHTLLYSAAVQALETSVPGTVQQINKEKDRWIFNNSLKYL